VRTLIVVQARMSSRRLPGKVLLPLAGAPAIVRMMERVRRAGRAERCLVATSTHPSDDPLAAVLAAHGIECFRGALDDVLGRYAAAVPPEYDAVVRLTGDCPLADPALIDRHIEVFARERARADYVSNAAVRTFPDGLDVEVVSRAMLERAAREATEPYDREHVLTWVQRNARCVAVTQDADHAALRWTLDTEEDYRFLASVYGRLYPRNPAFGSRDVYELLATA
jgi:spore coat polysaccharide biosynthesis protein SpsF (cytidylyltransferase family)